MKLYTLWHPDDGFLAVLTTKEECLKILEKDPRKEIKFVTVESGENHE